jgi:general secretion pathway protein G
VEEAPFCFGGAVMHERISLNNQKGLTLIELLAVIVILGVVAAISILAVGSIIEKSRHQAFVANAVAMKEAASLHKRASEIALNPQLQAKLTYADLVADGYLHVLEDPYTGRARAAADDLDQSFVEIKLENSELQYYVCLYGETKKLCGNNDEGILSRELSVDKIADLLP